MKSIPRGGLVLAVLLLIAGASPVDADYSPGVRAARAWLRDHTSDRAFRAAHRLWQVESGWSPWARNRTSGACGIPQFYPCRLYGQPRRQVVAGTRYVRGRYGSFPAARRHQVRFGWY